MVKLIRKILAIVSIILISNIFLLYERGISAENALDELSNRLEWIDSVRYENVKYHCSDSKINMTPPISADSMLFDLRLDYRLFGALKKLRFEGGLPTAYWRWAKKMMAEDIDQAELLVNIMNTGDNLRYRGQLNLSLGSTKDVLLEFRNLSDRFAKMKGYKNDLDLKLASLGIPLEIIESSLDKLADAISPVIADIYSETLQEYCLNTASVADMMKYVNENGRLYDGWFTPESSQGFSFEFWNGTGFEEEYNSIEVIQCENIIPSAEIKSGIYVWRPDIYVKKEQGYVYYRHLIQGYSAAIISAHLDTLNHPHFKDEITNNAVEEFFFKTAASISYLSEHILMNESYRDRIMKYQRYRELMVILVDVWIVKSELHRLKVNENEYPSNNFDSGSRFLKGYISGEEDFNRMDFMEPFNALKRLFIKSASLNILRTFERQLGKPLYKNREISVFVKNNLLGGNSGDDPGSNLQKVGINPFDISSLIDYYGF